MEPRYNEVPRDWENVFVISGVRYKQNPLYNEFVGKRPKSLLYRGMVNNYFALKLNSVMLHHPAFGFILQLLSGFERLNNIRDLMSACG